MINDNSELFQREISRRFGIAQSNHVLSETIQRCSCSCQPNRSGSRNGESAILLRQILGEKFPLELKIQFTKMRMKS